MKFHEITAAEISPADFDIGILESGVPSGGCLWGEFRCRGPQISFINCDHAAPKLCEIINEISGCNGYHQPNQSSKFREIPRRCLRKFGERERAEACGRVLGLAWVRAGSGRESRGVLGRGRRSHLACVFSALL